MAPHASLLAEILSPDERERADRFRFAKDRLHFTLSRAALRTILGLYLESSPKSVRFAHNSFGKPLLVGEAASGPLHFNASNSHELALYAFSAEQEVGVDVEYIRPEFASEEIAGRFFSRRETAALLGLAPELRARAFFDCWTRKEAYIKARGMGLSLPLDCFDVSLAPGEPAALLATRGTEPEAALWSLREIELENDYVAAIAVEGSGWRLRRWLWP